MVFMHGGGCADELFVGMRGNEVGMHGHPLHSVGKHALTCKCKESTSIDVGRGTPSASPQTSSSH